MWYYAILALLQVVAPAPQLQDTLTVALPEHHIPIAEPGVSERVVEDYRLWQRGEFGLHGVCLYGRVTRDDTVFLGRTFLLITRVLEADPVDCPGYDAYTKSQWVGYLAFIQPPLNQDLAEMQAAACSVLTRVHERTKLIRMFSFVYGVQPVKGPNGLLVETPMVAGCVATEGE